MKIYLETNRFYLREMLPEDAEGLFIMDSDPEVHKYLGNNPVKDLETCQNVVQFVRQQYLDHGIGRWSIVDKASGEFAGWSGFKLNTKACNGHINYIDIGYRLQRRHWGKGIASECATSCLDYGLRVLGFKDIYAAAQIENMASNRILRKIGLTAINEFEYEGTICQWYAYLK